VDYALSGVHDLALFVLAGWLLNLTPGPDMAYFAARSAAGGFRDGAAAVVGVTAGCVVHTLAAAAGLSALLAASATAFTLVKLAGAAYLLYIGTRLLLCSARDNGHDAAAPLPTPAPPLRIFREAFFINVFNPKVALFFLAFLPQFIAHDASQKALTFVLLGCLFNVNSLLVNLPIAWLAARAGRGLRASPRLARAVQGALGAFFVALAARLAALERT
jgi:threonine/homoserine/homoserine lactone efflux protein